MFDVPAIYIVTSMTQTSLSVVFSILVLNIHHHTSATPVADWLRLFALRFVSRLLCMGRLDSPRRSPDCVTPVAPTSPLWSGQDLEDRYGDGFAAGGCKAVQADLKEATVGDQESARTRNAADWQNLARVVDRILLLIFLGIDVAVTYGTYSAMKNHYDISGLLPASGS